MSYFIPKITARLTKILREVIKIEAEHRVLLTVKKIDNISKFLS